MRITACAPVRIDFAGAWTDVPYFADAFGGATLNAAIALYVTGSLEATEEADTHALDSITRDNRLDAQAVTEAGSPALIVNYGSSIPSGSGLGTSATLNVVWLALARREPVASVEDKMHIGELAYQIEKTLGIIGGKQDQYAAAVGGINLFEFNSEGVNRLPVTLPAAQISELEQRLVLCYTGKARLSSNIHRNVWSNFRQGNPATLQALFNLRQSAYEARKALENWDLEKFANLISQQRFFMRDLDASTSNSELEAFFAAVEADVLGGKPCGAGGGGCLFFIARDTAARERVKSRLQTMGASVFDVAFDFEGLTLQQSP